jgi:Domain of Unknown Function (DUF1080)
MVESPFTMSTPTIRLIISLLILLTVRGFSEEQPQPLSLVSLTEWKVPGTWAIAGNLVGSTQEKKWKSIEPGEGVLYNGPGGKAGNLESRKEHGDVEIEAEFMVPKGSNSGIYLMGRYEVQILDSYGKADAVLTYGDCGGIYERWDESKPEKEKGYEGTAPATNASSAPGAWQTFLIRFRAPRFDGEGRKIANARFIRVEHNGVVIHEDVEVTGPTRGGIDGPEKALGPISVQGDHGPVAFKKLEVRPAKFE